MVIIGADKEKNTVVYEAAGWRYSDSAGAAEIMVSGGKSVYLMSRNGKISKEQYNELTEKLLKENSLRTLSDEYVISETLVKSKSDSKVLWEKRFSFSDHESTVRVINDNVLSCEKDYDLLVCSAFKGSYKPYPNTMIGGLYNDLKISLKDLAEKPAFSLENGDCWITTEIDSKFKRIACVELLKASDKAKGVSADTEKILQTFEVFEKTLRLAISSGVKVKSIALPFLGTGNQGIEPCYMASTMMNRILSIIENSGVEKIDIYDVSKEKCEYLANTYVKWFVSKSPKVFISYCSKDNNEAEEVYRFLEKNGIPTWKAPQSIPDGADYTVEIPAALGKVKVVVFLITEKSLQSVWVRKEVGTAFSNKCVIIPCRIQDVKLDKSFKFMLEGTQILNCINKDLESCILKTVQKHI